MEPFELIFVFLKILLLILFSVRFFMYDSITLKSSIIALGRFEEMAFLVNDPRDKWMQVRREE